jgi:AcrR family transcriptional regulator
MNHDRFHTATIKELSNEAKVSQVSIYNYFGSKDELLFEAIGKMMEEQLKRYEHLLDGQMPYPKLMYTVMTEAEAYSAWNGRAVYGGGLEGR